MPHVTAIRAFNEKAKAQGWPFVVALADAFDSAELAAALLLWRDKASGRAMPGRADMTARAMKPWLTHMSLIERVEAKRYRVRLHGTALARYSGDGTGKFLEEVVLGGRVAGYTALYDLLHKVMVPLRVVSHYQAPEIAYLTGESLIAPLSAPGATAPFILSITYAKPRMELAGA